MVRRWTMRPDSEFRKKAAEQLRETQLGEYAEFRASFDWLIAYLTLGAVVWAVGSIGV
jgi:hypothetical protein